MAALPEAAWAEVAMEVGLEVEDLAAAVMAEEAGAKGRAKVHVPAVALQSRVHDSIKIESSIVLQSVGRASNCGPLKISLSDRPRLAYLASK